MNVNALLAEEIPAPNQPFHPPATTATPHHSNTAMTPKSLSPNVDAKAVTFQLRDSQNEPKTFHIRPHDSTDAIIDTVKHLLGISRLYDLGVSLEDADEVSFIPSYENFTDGMTVFVRLEEAIPPDFARRHSYNLRQLQNGPRGASSNSSSRTYEYPPSRSVSPVSRGRRSTSATTTNTVNDRSRQLKRSALEDHYATEGYHPDAQWSYLMQQHLPDGFEEPRTKAGSVASADISVENILEGSRRKRPKFSSDELPLFPPPTALPTQDRSASSLSPSRPPPVQLTTPYTQRHFSFSHPTPPSNAGDYGYQRAHASIQAAMRGNGSVTVPTPAPTVTSCISDEDVAMQLMRLGNANASMGETRIFNNGYVSDGGEYDGEDDGRSDTTELPDPLPPIGNTRYGLPDSPILFPTGHKKYKSLDEILPSFDTTEPSDDENQPPLEHEYAMSRRSTRAISNSEEEVDDETDDKSEKENINDVDDSDDLDDVPLKMRRERLFKAGHRVFDTKLKQKLPKGFAKAIKRQPMPMPQPKSKPKPVGRPKMDPHYPISPASPPASRKPSMASSSGKPRPVDNATPGNHSLSTPSSENVSAMPSADHYDETEEFQRPRCQRCRKSKKGCDRERPCQRCKDAGIPAEGCISEDEAGTRRGRQVAAAARRAGLQNTISKLKMKKKSKAVPQH